MDDSAPLVEVDAPELDASEAPLATAPEVADAASRPQRPRKSALQEQLRKAKGANPAAVSEPELPLAAPRPEMRAAFREEDPRTRAARRTQELLDHGELPDEGPDEFYVDRDIVPPGWDYEWKRLSVVNQEDPAYQVQLAQGGWEPVPTGRHPEFMPRGSKSGTIERKGMILMERPMEITKRVRMRDTQRARDQVRQKENLLTAAPKGQFDRSNKGDSLVRVNRSYEPLQVPNE